MCGAEAHSESTLPSAPDEAREDAYVEAEAASRGEADTVPDDLPSSAHDAAHRLPRAASSHSVLYARLRRTALLALSLCRQFCALQGFPTDAMPCDSAATLIARSGLGGDNSDHFLHCRRYGQRVELQTYHGHFVAAMAKGSARYHVADLPTDRP